MKADAVLIIQYHVYAEGQLFCIYRKQLCGLRELQNCNGDKEKKKVGEIKNWVRVYGVGVGRWVGKGGSIEPIALNCTNVVHVSFF